MKEREERKGYSLLDGYIVPYTTKFTLEPDPIPIVRTRGS